MRLSSLKSIILLEPGDLALLDFVFQGSAPASYRHLSQGSAPASYRHLSQGSAPASYRRLILSHSKCLTQPARVWRSQRGPALLGTCHLRSRRDNAPGLRGPRSESTTLSLQLTSKIEIDIGSGLTEAGLVFSYNSLSFYHSPRFRDQDDHTRGLQG